MKKRRKKNDSKRMKTATATGTGTGTVASAAANGPSITPTNPHTHGGGQVGWLVGRSVGWLIGWLVGGSVVDIVQADGRCVKCTTAACTINEWFHPVHTSVKPFLDRQQQQQQPHTAARDVCMSCRLRPGRPLCAFVAAGSSRPAMDGRRD